MANKIKKKVNFSQDFVVIAEFCEHKGPVARHILGEPENFNVSKFVEKILSVPPPNDLSDTISVVCCFFFFS